MIKTAKIYTTYGDNRPIEVMLNEFFQTNNLGKSDLVYIGMDNNSSPDYIGFYIFYDDERTGGLAR